MRVRRALLWALALLGACRDSTSPSAPIARRLAGLSCESLIPAAEAYKSLGHPVFYREVRHEEGPYESISCENRTRVAAEVFAFDAGCGVGARERFVGAARAVKKAIRLTEPRVGDEAWASENVYLSWFARRNCYTTVLLSWRRPHPERLRAFAERLGRGLPP